MIGSVIMKFYSFENPEKPVIMLISGTCCHWKSSFKEVIPLLKESFYVVCVSYDGFDETENTVFTTMLNQTQKIERYIKEHFNGKIFACYGCSLGGSIVGLLIHRRVIHMEHGILGSSDLDQGGILTGNVLSKMVCTMVYPIYQTGRLPNYMKNRIYKNENGEYMKKMVSMMGLGEDRQIDMSFVKPESIRNQFLSDYITPLPLNIDVAGTTVHCFYATKMGAKYLIRYQRHFKNPDIVYHNLQHEELLVCYPEKWASEVRRCCNV